MCTDPESANISRELIALLLRLSHPKHASVVEHLIGALEELAPLDEGCAMFLDEAMLRMVSPQRPVVEPRLPAHRAMVLFGLDPD